ncbi:MAG TPA: tetratricopeptide repeat protein [Bryobacteraceae bacterium]|nr:tetratricopeptide repeat protein [Bryobacteraceae bacterium]
MSINTAALILLLTSLAANAAQPCNIEQTFRSATDLLRAKQYDSARNELNTVRDCGNLSAVQRFQLGWLYGRARRFNTALRIFESVPLDTPDLQTHAYAIALSKFELRDYQGSLDALKKLQAHVDLDANSQNLLAVSYSKLGLYQQAYTVLSEEIQRNPRELTAYLNVITVCAEGGDFNAAARFASRAAELFPNSAEVFIVRGAAYTLLGQLDQAHRDFVKAMGLSPERPDARFFAALIDYKQGKFSDALSILRSARKEGIADADLDYLSAECLLKIDPADTQAALHDLNHAIELNPRSVAARTLRGKLLLDANRPAQALGDLELAAKQEPSSRSAIYNLARAYRALDRPADAEALFRRLRNRQTDTLSEMGDARLSGALTGSGEQP